MEYVLLGDKLDKLTSYEPVVPDFFTLVPLSIDGVLFPLIYTTPRSVMVLPPSEDTLHLIVALSSVTSAIEDIITVG